MSNQPNREESLANAALQFPLIKVIDYVHSTLLRHPAPD